MRALTLLALALPVAALANDFTDILSETVKDHKPKGKARLDDYMFLPGRVDISGVVELPLYHSDAGPMVEVRLLDEASEERFFLLVDPGLSVVALDKPFIEQAGGKPKAKRVHHATGVDVDVARVDGFRLGGLTFEDLPVLAYEGDPSAPHVAGVLGLAAFPELAGALLVSEGKLVLAPAAQGAEALGRVKSKPMPFEVAELSEHDLGKDHEWVVERQSLLVDGRLGERDVVVSLTRPHSQAPGRVAADAVEGHERVLSSKSGDTYALPLQVGELDLGAPELLGTSSQAFSKVPWAVSLPVDLVNGLDVAWDPSAQLVAVARAEQSKLASHWDLVIEDTLKGLDPDPETGEAPDAETAAGVYASLADLYAQAGDPAARIDAATKALEAKADACDAHLALGQALFDAGRYEEALPHLRAAGEAWSAWDAYSYDERKEFEEQKAEAEEKEEAWTGPVPQPGACSAAWAGLAEAELALGRPDEAIRLYDEHGALNVDLALVAGNAWLTKGNLAKAEAHYRQANLTRPSAKASTALAVVRLSQGQLDAAWEHLDVRLRGDDRLAGLEIWLEALGRAEGAEAALAFAADLAARLPDNPSMQAALGVAQVAAGQDGAEAFARAVGLFEQRLVAFPREAATHAAYAEALRLAGRAEEARAAAEQALALDARDAVALHVLAELARAEGDAALAARHAEAARRAAALDPLATWWFAQR